MKILLIDNNTKHFKSLSRALAGHDVEIQTYRPGMWFHDHDKALVVLSGGGGEGLEIDDKDKRGRLWYEDQMKFIRETNKPIVGICMGFEVMAKAHGKEVPKLSKLVYGQQKSAVTEAGWKLLGKHDIKQVEAHSWGVAEAPDNFDVLAQSTTGVELMFDPVRRQIASQFHPELDGSLRLKQLMQLALSQDRQRNKSVI